MQTQDANVDLKAGEHDLKIDYFENEMMAAPVCVLSWRLKGGEKEVVPPARFPLIAQHRAPDHRSG